MVRAVGDARISGTFSAAPQATFFAVAFSCAETIFRYDHRVHAPHRHAQARAEVVRIGHAIKDQEERVIQCGDQIRQIVFLILTARFTRAIIPLVNRAFTFLSSGTDGWPAGSPRLRLQCVDQRHQTFVFTPFQNEHFLKTLRCALQQACTAWMP